MVFNPIETPRLRLRCVDLRDAECISALMTPPVSRWLAMWPSPFSVEHARERIAGRIEQAKAGTALPFVAERKREGDVIGWIGLTKSLEDPRRGIFGFWLGEAFHGQGYMREAGPAAIAAGFRLLDLDVIEAAAQVENAGSIAVMKSCGMTLVGEKMVHAPARGRDDLCVAFEVKRAAT